VPDNIWRG